MRKTAVVLIILFCTTTAYAYTFILQSGKRIEGTLLLEEAELVRVMDASGIELRLKKSQLDVDATLQANVPHATAGATAPDPAPAGKSETRQIPIFTNSDVAGAEDLQELARNRDVTELSRKAVKVERDYRRLTAECRSAGAGHPGVRRTEVYIVKGKEVAVTGNYAHPSEIERARSVCNHAMQTGSLLDTIKKLLLQLQQ